MKLKIYKTICKNGEYSIDTDLSHSFYSPVIEEFSQEIEIDESKWEKEL